MDTIDDHYPEQREPLVADLGTVQEVTLGSAGFDKPDDTEYWH
ncbi:hypothetical protein [Streptomyces spiramenti]|nr:hypothetical protein [Streptomyces spiramenti]